MEAEYKATILIVDDNPQNLQVLGNIVEGEGYDVALAMSGKQALSFLTKEKADLLLLDVMMPEMNGYEVCRTLKESPDLKDIPIIFLTAKTETTDIVAGFEVGGVDYVTKPFNATELLARIRTHVRLRHAIEEIKTLRGMIPICAYCKKIRDDEGFWEQVEVYIQGHSEAVFSHGICPDCAKEVYAELEEWEWKHRKDAKKKQ